MNWVQGILISLYPWTLALHVIAVVSWMAGMFYLPRLFVYHVEKAHDNEELDLIYQEMEAKLLRVIMNPAMIATWIFGLSLAATPGLVDFGSVWPWVKFAAVIAMTGFHHSLALWRKDFVAGTNERPGKFYRLANEVPTVLMFVIVIMVIVRPF
jgi:putative membrane protein